MPRESSKKIEVVYFKSEQGNIPVRTFINNRSEDMKNNIYDRIKWYQRRKASDFQYYPGDSSYSGKHSRISKIKILASEGGVRILFARYKHKMILLHGIIKKTQAMPPRTLDLALRRYNEWLAVNKEEKPKKKKRGRK